MFIFQIHFLLLQNSGDGDGFVTSEFQHTLGGRGTFAGMFNLDALRRGFHDIDINTIVDVAIGSSITIHHVNTQGGYLHSHPHNYPGGSKRV